MQFFDAENEFHQIYCFSNNSVFDWFLSEWDLSNTLKTRQGKPQKTVIIFSCPATKRGGGVKGPAIKKK